MAAGDFPHESVSLCLGHPGGARPRGVSRGRASPRPARPLAAPSAAPGGSAPNTHCSRWVPLSVLC